MGDAAFNNDGILKTAMEDRVKVAMGVYVRISIVTLLHEKVNYLIVT